MSTYEPPYHNLLKICENCYYFDNGVCRRYPPTKEVDIVYSSPAREEIAPIWPVVLKTDWCGEWSAK